MKYAEYIQQIEIDSLWSGKRHVVWNLDRQVNILSGINGVGKSTILNKVVKGLSAGGEFPSHMLKGVRLKVVPEDARWIRYDVIRSFDRPLVNPVSADKLNTSLADLATELDIQLFFLQRKYLDYQVNIGNRIIQCLQEATPDAAQKAQTISAPKKRFQDLIDDLFADTGKTVQRLAVISGAGGSLFEDALAQGADCLLTGEANHHHAIDAKRLGLSLIAAGHYATEFPVTAAVAEKLRGAFPALEVLVSEDARDPYTYL